MNAPAGHAGFASAVVRWQEVSGRNDLPWQNTRDPYRVWLSEIMLQQTQVATVREYFSRFLARFADVRALAAASTDDVLALWSGLGYYSRARNLHRCAQQVVQLHGGEFPRSAAGLVTLPGIGRSTAAAIASICFGERAAILDGNVRRVVTRLTGFGKDLAVAAHERELWTLTESLLPTAQVARAMPRYTQGLMDLGATVCTLRKPDCTACPVRAMCVAHAQGEPQRYPVRTRKLRRTAESLWLLWAHQSDGSVMLHRRPDSGIWAGLYCLQVFDSREALEAAVPARLRSRLQDVEPIMHVLTHKDLYLRPVRVAWTGAVPEGAAWYGAAQWPALGLPAPVRKLLAAGMPAG